MKNRGLFSFVLVALFVHANFIVLGMNTSLLESHGETRQYLIQMENANFARAIIEENMDYLIVRTMETEIGNRNTEPLLIKEKLFMNLERFFAQIKDAYADGPKIGFEMSKKGPLGRKHGSLPMLDMRDSFSVLVLNAGEKVFLAEFTYTGGLFRDKTLYAVIAYKGYGQLFIVPINYSSKILAAVP